VHLRKVRTSLLNLVVGGSVCGDRVGAGAILCDLGALDGWPEPKRVAPDFVTYCCMFHASCSAGRVAAVFSVFGPGFF